MDIVTSLDTYCASQSNFSANIVALDAAGVAARITTTIATTYSMLIPQSESSFMIAIMMRGSITWRSAKKRYMCLSFSTPSNFISARRRPITTIDSGATRFLSIVSDSITKPGTYVLMGRMKNTRPIIAAMVTGW